MTDQVLTFIENSIGRIRLNRPKAIHALTPVSYTHLTLPTICSV